MQIIGTAGADDYVIRLVMEILASHKFPMKNIITHEYSQGEINEALQMAGNVKEAVKVIIKYE
jgi:threonine dehydrogenase-like Zn-dependent dehydrogenase